METDVEIEGVTTKGIKYTKRLLPWTSMLYLEAVGVQKFILAQDSEGRQVPVTAVQAAIMAAAMLTNELRMSGGIAVRWA